MEMCQEEKASLVSLISARKFANTWLMPKKSVEVVDVLFTTYLILASYHLYGVRIFWLIGGLCLIPFLLASAYDIYITNKIMNLKGIFEQRGLAFTIREMNPVLSDYPTLKELIFGPSSLVGLVICALILVFPLSTIGFTAGIIAVGLRNRNVYQKATYEIELYDWISNYVSVNKGKEMPVKDISMPSLPTYLFGRA